jgi:hypothetical protein
MPWVTGHAELHHQAERIHDDTRIFDSASVAL